MMLSEIANEQSNQVIYSVSELNQMINTLLVEGLPLLQIEGEISNFACPRSGHWYFCLKDAKAQVRCVLFQGKQRQRDLVIKDGMHVLIQAQPKLYETRGEFQLVAENITLMGDGILKQKFEALKQALYKEGLFEVARKRVLPTFIQKLGIVTSPSGAAIKDILSVLKRRFPGIAVILYPTLVQGKGAAEQISQQINLANQRKECEVLIVTRGGGPLEDLWPFNEEIVARTIASSDIPVISAVGHEIDFSISDFVADVRASTPSAAAELVSPDQVAWTQQLTELKNALTQRMKACLNWSQEQITNLSLHLKPPKQRLQNYHQYLDDLEWQLKKNVQYHLKAKQQILLNLSTHLEVLSPLATLNRGYALIHSNENRRIVRSSKQVHVNDLVTAQLAEGKIICQVKEQVSP